jgi:hypothetical protein
MRGKIVLCVLVLGLAGPAAAQWDRTSPNFQGTSPFQPFPGSPAPSALDRTLDRREQNFQNEQWRMQQDRQYERERRDTQARDRMMRPNDRPPGWR